MRENPVRAALGRAFRLGIIGGAPPSMIGPIHRMAAVMDHRFEIVAGVLSSQPERSRSAGQALGLASDRCYGTVAEMIAAEGSRADGIEAACVLTPNDTHFAFARALLGAGLDLMVEKPLCNTAQEARELRDLAARAGAVVAITHTYSGYPMIREMRSRIIGGGIGDVRLIQVDYLGSGLAAPVEDLPDAARRWRLDPARSGPSLVLLDVGTHAHHLAEFVTGEELESVCADVGTIVPGRRVHDYAQVRFQTRGGIKGRLDACQAAAGASNDIAIRVFGSRGHLEWRHRDHARLSHATLEGDVTSSGAGQTNLGASATAAVRLARAGHPEGIPEAIANLYADFADLMLERRTGRRDAAAEPLVPTASAGLRGLAFVEACLESAARDGAWTRMIP